MFVGWIRFEGILRIGIWFFMFLAGLFGYFIGKLVFWNLEDMLLDF